MAVFEFDSEGLRIIGYNEGIKFYDTNRILQQQIYLQEDNTLSIAASASSGSATSSISAGFYIGLDADLLDGLQGNRYVRTDGVNPLIADWDVGAFKITADELDADTAILLGGTSINTGGTLTNVGYLDQAQTFAAAQKIDVSSTTALLVEDDGVHDNILVVDTVNSRVGINTTPSYTLHVNGTIVGGPISGSYFMIGATNINTGGTLTNVAYLDQANVFTENTTTDHIYPNASDTYDLGSSSLLWRKMWASELDTVIFAENTISVTGGWWIIPHQSGTLPSALSDSDDTCDFGAALEVGDIICMRSSLQVEYFTVGANVTGTEYKIGADGSGSRNDDGSGANTWVAGTVWVNFGQSGNDDGYIEFDAQTVGPRMVFRKTGATYDATTPTLVIGDLDESYGYTATTYGVGIGDEDSSHIVIESTNGIRMRDGSNNVLVQIDTSGNVILGQVATDYANVYWDAATQQLKFRGGTDGEEVQAYIDTDGSIVGGGGDTVIDSDGITLMSGAVYGASEALKFYGIGEIYGYHGSGTGYLNIENDTRDIDISMWGSTGGGLAVDSHSFSIGSTIRMVYEVASGTRTNDGLFISGTLVVGSITTTSVPSYQLEVRESGGDYLGIEHDGSDVNFVTDAGQFVFKTDEGTDQNGAIEIHGKGTGYGIFQAYDEGDDEYLALACADEVGYIEVKGSSPGDLRIQYNAYGNVQLFRNCGTDVSRVLQVWGDFDGNENYLNIRVNQNEAYEGVITGDFRKLVIGGRGIQIPVLSADISNPPTDAQLDSATGYTPATAGQGFMFLMNDSDSNNNYLVWSDGVVWRYTQGSFAT